MNRIQLACYGLIASAFVLGGLLLVALGRGGDLANPAQADLVIARQNFTIMTAQTRTGHESLFVLNNNAGRLLIYDLNVARKRFEVGANVDVTRLFARAGNGGGGNVIGNGTGGAGGGR